LIWNPAAWRANSAGKFRLFSLACARIFSTIPGKLSAFSNRPQRLCTARFAQLAVAEIAILN
jgi:hypothetical protein